MHPYIHQMQTVLIRVDFCGHHIDEAFSLIERLRGIENLARISHTGSRKDGQDGVTDCQNLPKVCEKSGLDLHYWMKGETAFLKKKYYQALVAFLHIGDQTYKKILAYRAAGYLCEERGWFEKSAIYLTKSLSLSQADYSSVKLLLTILQKLGRYEQAKEIERILNEIIRPHLPIEKQIKSFSISDREIAELKQIFQNSSSSIQLFEM